MTTQRLADDDVPRPVAEGSEAGTTAPDPALAPWSPAKRVGFRLVCAYLVLYNFPFPLSAFPFLAKVTKPYEHAWELIVPWVGAHVLHLSKPITVLPSGSGDTTFNYVQLFCYVVIALLAAAVWSVLDRRRTNYVVARDRLRIYVRYALATTMLGYGAYKVIKSQFPDPSLDRLITPYGQFSPMGVLWSFMGYSYAYNLFTGMGEMVGAALLFFRKTTSLGAALLISVLANVVLLNFAYDVPVKLYSAHLLLMSAYLIAPDARRLFDVLVHNRAVGPVKFVPAASGRWRGARLVIKPLFCVFAILWPLKGSREQGQMMADMVTKTPLYGIYDVERFERNGLAVPPLTTDSTRWRQVVISCPQCFAARLMNDDRRRFRLDADTTGHSFTLTLRTDTAKHWPMAYAKGDSGSLTINGTMGADSLHLVLRRVDHTKFLLVNRGYHWVNEFPFNR
ncbi:MAG: hypothetical protein ABJD07_11100 [Gemmatimonadaceae bacterium]